MPGDENQDFEVNFGDDLTPPAGGEDPTNDTPPAGDQHSGEYDPSKEIKDPTQDKIDPVIAEFIPEEFKETFAADPELSKLTTKEDLIKAFVDLKKTSVGMIAVPGEGATKEEFDKFYEKLGRPATVEGYELDKNIPEGLEFSEEMFTGFTELAHETGMTKAQVQKAYEWYNNTSLAMSKGLNERINAVYKKSVDDAVVELKKEWGTDYETNLSEAVTIAKQFLSPETRQYLNATKLGNNPLLIKDFYALSKQVSGSQMHGDDAPKVSSSLAELDAEMEKNLRAPDYTTNTTLQARNKQIAEAIIAIQAKQKG